MSTVLIQIPAFVDWRAAARFPVVIPPAPIDSLRLPYNSQIRFGASGACTVEIPDHQTTARPHHQETQL